MRLRRCIALPTAGASSTSSGRLITPSATRRSSHRRGGDARRSRPRGGTARPRTRPPAGGRPWRSGQPGAVAKRGRPGLYTARAMRGGCTKVRTAARVGRPQRSRSSQAACAVLAPATEHPPPPFPAMGNARGCWWERDGLRPPPGRCGTQGTHRAARQQLRSRSPPPHLGIVVMAHNIGAANPASRRATRTARPAAGPV
jgi:hypothetical protein